MKLVLGGLSYLFSLLKPTCY